MRILKHGQDDARRIASLMLCMEHGAKAYNFDLTERDHPHDAWPTIPLKAMTKKGFDTTVHYKPSVGIIYYTPSDELDIKKFIDNIVSELETIPHDHLLEKRAVAAASSSVFYCSKPVYIETVVKRIEATKPKDNNRVTRLLYWTMNDSKQLPPHYSTNAVFTW